MPYQIDQSGKIEQTNKNTILCLSNQRWDAILIKAKTKRQLQEIFRRSGQPRNFIIFTFCAGLALLLKRNKQVKSTTIDREYWGKEPVIKNILEEMLTNTNTQTIPFVNFSLIGKRSPAHLLAKKVARGKQKAGAVLSMKKIIQIIKNTEVGKRLKNA